MIEKLFDLRRKSALVVGASRGLGKAIALALAGAGSDVAVASRSLSLINNVRDEIIALDRKSLAIKTHIENELDVVSMAEEVVDAFGKIDILVNNAGIYLPSKVLDMTVGDWERTLNINLKGFFLSCKAVGRYMVHQKSGKIINISSILGRRAAQRSSSYSASKAAIIQLTRSLALEFAPYNINVNGIAPGWFETEMVEDELGDPKTRKFLLSKTPLKRFGTPAELGGAVIFLASKSSDFMTGETISIDGGFSIW